MIKISKLIGYPSGTRHHELSICISITCTSTCFYNWVKELQQLKAALVKKVYGY